MAKEWAKSFYASKSWKECREGYINSVHNLCERCLVEGRIETGKILHHTIYLTPDNINDPYVSLNWDNLEYVCQYCHNKEHHGNGDSILRDDVMFDEDGNLIQKIIDN